MTSIVEAIGRRAGREPDRIALLCGDEAVTYGQLWGRVLAAAGCISACGVRPGDRVLLSTPSNPQFAAAYLATHLLGAIAVLLEPNALAFRRDELIARTRPVLALGMEAPMPPGTSLVARSFRDLEEYTGARRDFSPPALEAVAELIFTTGTTGRPKGVVLTHANIAAAASHVSEATGMGEGQVNLIPIPLYHSFGLGSLRCFLVAGASVVLVQGFRLPGEIFRALERHAATGIIGVPAGFAILLKFGDSGLGPFADRLRYVEVGSAPMPLEHKRMLAQLLPRTKLFMHYGLTEAGRSAYSEFHRDSERLDTVGLPSPRVRVEIRDENGHRCATGERGVLWVGGGHVSKGYWEAPELDAATFVDGWMRTGDVAHLDAEGYIHLHGRQDDVVNVGGYKVAPDEVETALEQHPAVAEAACIGVPDPRNITGQAVRAYLVLAPGQAEAPAAELSQWVAARLEAYKVPAQYRWVGELPRSASGKLFRAVLRKQAAAEQ